MTTFVKIFYVVWPCQNQINEQIIEPNSKPKETVMYTFGVLLIDEWVNNRTALKIMMSDTFSHALQLTTMQHCTPSGSKGIFQKLFFFFK